MTSCRTNGFRTLTIVITVVILQGILTTTWLLGNFQHCNTDVSALRSVEGASEDFSIFRGRPSNSENDRHETNKHGLLETKNEDGYYKDAPLRLPRLEDSDNSFGGVQARAFEPWNQPQLPCFQAEPDWKKVGVQRSPTRKGFVMLKIMKTGGSTAAGINVRLARNVAQRYFPNLEGGICKIRNDHATARSFQLGRRERDKSFVWTILRDPIKRAVSQFFHFEVSRKKVEPTDKNFMNFFASPRHYLNTMTTIPKDKALSDDPVHIANKIFDDYNFIGITERMDESAVALQMLLGLTTGDVLFLNSKSSGGYDDGASKSGCTYIVPSFLSPGMKDYFNTPRWKGSIDVLMHQAANRSLDLTIERLGKEKFQTQLARFKHAQQVVRETCEPTIRMPCGPDGSRNKVTDCLWADSACGTSCMDQVAETLNLYQEA